MTAKEKSTDSGERRKHERIKKGFPIDYSLLDEFARGDSSRNGRLLDIGGGGLCFLAREPVTEQSSLVLLLDVLGWNPVMDEWVREQQEYDLGPMQVICTVVRVCESEESPGEYEVAVRFSGQIK